MDFSKLTQNNWIAAGGGILAFIATLLPWYSVDFGFGASASTNGWGSGIAAWLGCLLALAAGVLVALKASGQQEVKAGGLATEQLAMILAAIGFVLVLLRWLTQTSYTSFGLYLGLIATAAAAAGSFLSAKDNGIGLPTGDDFTGGGSSGGGTSEF